MLLAIHRLDLAEAEYLAARKWADDSLLIQLIEAWIGLAKGGRSTQQAFYVYDELAQNPAAADTVNAVPSLVGKATALAANADFAGANKMLDAALKLDANHARHWPTRRPSRRMSSRPQAANGWTSSGAPMHRIRCCASTRHTPTGIRPACRIVPPRRIDRSLEKVLANVMPALLYNNQRSLRAHTYEKRGKP